MDNYRLQKTKKWIYFMEFTKQLKFGTIYTWKRDKKQSFDLKGSEKNENNATYVSDYC